MHCKNGCGRWTGDDEVTCERCVMERIEINEEREYARDSLLVEEELELAARKSWLFKKESR